MITEHGSHCTGEETGAQRNEETAPNVTQVADTELGLQVGAGHRKEQEVGLTDSGPG